MSSVQIKQPQQAPQIFWRKMWNAVTHAIAKPPYAGLPWLICAYVLISCLVFDANGPFTGHIVGFDDQVRMSQVLNWINGAGWYDRTIHRVNAPEGFDSIWTRIVDIPIAIITVLGSIVTDQWTAALASSVIWPLGQLMILFAVARYSTRPLAGKREANLVALFLMFTALLNKQNYTLAGFFPGEASHHSWYVILNMLMYGTAGRIIIGIRGRAPTMLLALAISMLVAVGIEGFPMIGGICAILGVCALIFNNAGIAGRAAKAVGMGALGSLILLPMNQPPAHMLDVSFAQPSILGPILISAAALFLFAESVLLRTFQRQRFLAVASTGLTAIAIAVCLVIAFPQILDGPAAALSPTERDFAFHNHPEAWPMMNSTTDLVEYLCLTLPTLLAVIAGIVAIYRTKNQRRRRLYAGYLGFALLGGLMAQALWRYVHHAMTAASIWLLWIWQRLRARLRKGPYLALKSFGLFVALCPLPLLLIPAAEHNLPFTAGVVLFPGKTFSVPVYCDGLEFSGFLNKRFGKDTNMLVPDWDSSQFLLYSDLHIDFLSNYPSHDKFVDNMRFFKTADPEDARDVAHRHNVDLVAICKYVPDVATQPLNFSGQLATGHVPGWLHPLQVPQNSPYLLYAVDKNAAKGSS